MSPNLAHKLLTECAGHSVWSDEFIFSEIMSNFFTSQCVHAREYGRVLRLPGLTLG